MTPDAARQEALLHVLKSLAGAAVVGAAARAGAQALAPPRGTLATLKPPEKLVVPLPARAVADAPEDDLDPRPALKAAHKAADDAALGPLTHGVSLGAPDWAKQLLPSIAGLWDRVVPDQTPMSGAAATSPQTVPWRLPGIAAAGVLGGAAGWAGADQLSRLYQRRRSQGDLDAARDAYNQEVLAGYQAADKAAADRLAAALDRVWAAAKKADLDPAALADSAEKSPAYRAFFPLTNFGPLGAALSVGTMGLAGAMGGYLGYRHARDTDVERMRREALEQAEREELDARPPLVVGEFRRPPAAPPAAPAGVPPRRALTA